MKSIKNFIQEKLILNKNIINKNSYKYKYSPKNKKELRKIIDDIIENNYMDEVINFNDINTSNITNMSDLFFGYEGLTYIDVSNWDTSNVTDMCDLFANCFNLEKIDGLENWNISKVENIRGMFDNCTNLISLDLTNWKDKVKNIKYIEELFYNCYELKSVGNINDWELESLTEKNAVNIFYKCNKLKCNIKKWYDYFDTTNSVIKSPHITL